ncbi:unnamed protein product [Closterium sp. Naga37s-1]|nr:unnamed protein product [Closterium sp. Naga37s-1]
MLYTGYLRSLAGVMGAQGGWARRGDGRAGGMGAQGGWARGMRRGREHEGQWQAVGMLYTGYLCTQGGWASLSAPRLRPRPRFLPPSAALLSLHSARPALAGSQQRKNIRRRTLHSPHSPTPSPLFPTLSPLSALPHPIPWIPSLSSLPCIPPSHSLSHPFHPSACPRPLSHSVPRNSRSRACPRALDAGAAAREERRGGEKEEEGEGDGEPEEERVGGAGAAATSPSAPTGQSLAPAALRMPPSAGWRDADGDAMPDVGSMCDVSLLHWRWRREGERVRDVWRGGRVVVRGAERERGGAGVDARCLALRLIGCLAPLAADVAHVQELVVRAAMEAEGQQEVSKGGRREGEEGKGGIRGSRSSPCGHIPLCCLCPLHPQSPFFTSIPRVFPFPASLPYSPPSLPPLFLFPPPSALFALTFLPSFD